MNFAIFGFVLGGACDLLFCWRIHELQTLLFFERNFLMTCDLGEPAAGRGLGDLFLSKIERLLIFVWVVNLLSYNYYQNNWFDLFLDLP